MTLQEFHDDLINDVNVRVATVGGFSEASFTEICAERLEEANELGVFSVSSFHSSDSKIRIDGASFDEADDSFRLFVTLYFGSAEVQTFGATEARQAFGRLQRFIEAVLNGKYIEIIDENHEARQIGDQLIDMSRPISRVRMYLLSDAALSSRIKDWPEGNVRDIPLEYHIWDLTRFHRAFESSTGIDEVEVEFTSGGEGLPCLAIHDPTAPYQSYLCVISGSELGRIYDEYGARLLEGNVRAFLSTKVKINQGIRRTLLEQPEMFFAYNNGIAAIASSVTTSVVDGVRKLISATGLQIVNGGQTTATVANVLRNDKQCELDRTFVPMKLAVVDGEHTSSMIEDISKYANSQNKVSDADFFSNHPYHRRLEKLSRRLLAPAQNGKQYETRWYYERARGQYLNEFVKLTVAQKEQLKLIIPKHQLITKTDLARSELSWLQRPHVVSQGAQSFMRSFAEAIAPLWLSDPDSINEEYFRNTVSRIILFRQAEQLVSKQAWYYSGFRGFVVSYSIARIAAELVQKKLGNIDLQRIWREQEIDEPLAEQIVMIADSVFKRITNLPDGQKNASQWVKRLSCWDAVSAMSVTLNANFTCTLIKQSDVKLSMRAAKEAQRQDSRIDDQSEVLALGQRYWTAALNWASKRGTLPSSDSIALRAASGSFGSIPTEKQSMRLLQLRRLFESQGFVFLHGR